MSARTLLAGALVVILDRLPLRLKWGAVGYGLTMRVRAVSAGSRLAPRTVTGRLAARSTLHPALAVTWLRPASTTLVDPSELLVRRPMGTQH
jgi:hypothetical protein